jgi:hypothetical protein|tara:strand:- start:128 stop:373 length:246 start_codon:yes stop_codon:yes gene_type:complete
MATPRSYNYLEIVGSSLRNVMPYEVSYPGGGEYKKRAVASSENPPDSHLFREYDRLWDYRHYFLKLTSGTHGLELFLPGAR